MMKLLKMVLNSSVFLLFLSCETRTTFTEIKNIEGEELQFIYTLDNDSLKNGPVNVYYNETNVIALKYNFVKDVMDGPFVSYYKNGNIKEEGDYRNWKRDGFWKFYSLSGDSLRTVNYIEDYKNGYEYTITESDTIGIRLYFKDFKNSNSYFSYVNKELIDVNISINDSILKVYGYNHDVLIDSSLNILKKSKETSFYKEFIFIKDTNDFDVKVSYKLDTLEYHINYIKGGGWTLKKQVNNILP